MLHGTDDHEHARRPDRILVAGPSNPLKGTALEDAADELESAIAALPPRGRFLYARVAPFPERVLATVMHIGTRGLVYVAYRSREPWPFLIALLTFVLADGLIGYRLAHEGKLTNLRVLNRTFMALVLLALAILAIFLLNWWP